MGAGVGTSQIVNTKDVVDLSGVIVLPLESQIPLSALTTTSANIIESIPITFSTMIDENGEYYKAPHEEMS